MTGPGRSPSSPWAQGTQGCSHDGRAGASFHPMLSPSQAGLPATTSLSERPSSNYFGLAVDNSSNLPISNPSPHVQKNWAPIPCTQASLPSPKLQLYSQESVSEGLVNLLRSESDIDKGRRESVLQRQPSNGHPSSNTRDVKPSFSYLGRGETGTRMQGNPIGHGLAGEQRPGSTPQGKQTSLY